MPESSPEPSLEPSSEAQSESQTTLRDELTQMVDEAEWEWLMPHAQRDAIVIVAPDLDLAEVGEALAQDNATAVQRWIAEQLLSKPSPEQLADWAGDRTRRFQALIVQPYVLVQDLPH
ncbi:MAG: DUF2288 domain-containing protein [Oscillatoriophycideae cyanobacterium NC_groundwater_1537_Pr4_S-0.65um_50_18]|nr:DUF2288 domain-containing protein [Oscillatoriophycideae cyanobacterium NC_groundwater_1537_Pr4_S-0.65um_50_18]